MPVVRLVRACSDLALSRRFCGDGPDLAVFAAYADHEGFGGPIVGWHLEPVVGRGATVSPQTSADAVVLCEPDHAALGAHPHGMRAAQFGGVPSGGPCWNRCGATVEGPDGYGTAAGHRAWSIQAE
jgi:hypothetical protein